MDEKVLKWFPLKIRSHFSLLMGLSKPSQIVARMDELDYDGCALVDVGNLAGCPAIQKGLMDTKKGKRKAKKPILGSQFFICKHDATIKQDNDALDVIYVLAKNENGWKQLIKASSASYKPEFMHKKPRLDLERLASFSPTHDFIVYGGSIGSDLANMLFTDSAIAYKVKSEDEVKSLLVEKWSIKLLEQIEKYKTLFGAENVFLEVELMDPIPAAVLLAKAMRWAGKKTGVDCIAVANSCYPKKVDAADQRILLCSAQETTMRDIQERLNTIEIQTSRFFTSNSYHIPTIEEIRAVNTEEEIANTMKVADMCSTFDLGDKPRFPQFPCPDGKTPDELLKLHCADGWKSKVVPIAKDKETQKIYSDRVKKELDVFLAARLSSYFLITEEIIQWARSKKIRTGIGRGSGAGCLVSYLLGIVKANPIPYDLLFERFYNAGRNTADRVALPDIDSDFETYRREEVIQHIRDLYGHDKVCQMSTFSRLQGRGALKEVLRAHERVSFEEMNIITESIPDEAEISDQLQVMREETGEASIIRWALENNVEELKQWCFLTPEGKLDGPLSLDFEQAIRLEGTKKSMGKHASGLIICSDVLADIVPMVWDKSSDEMIVGVDMRDAEAMGLVKFDILGTAVLDKLSMSQRIIRGEQ